MATSFGSAAICLATICAGAGSSPILFENLLILHFDGYDYQYIVALDKRTGKTVWRRDRDVDYGTNDGDMKKAFSTPLVIEVGGQLQLISPCSKATLAYDPLTRQRTVAGSLFELFIDGPADLSAAGCCFSTPDSARPICWRFGRRCESGSDGSSAVDDITATNVVWKLSKSVGSKPSALLVGDLIFFVHDAGVASCVEAKSGTVLWSKRLGGGFSASPIRAEGRVYYRRRKWHDDGRAGRPGV